MSAARAGTHRNWIRSRALPAGVAGALALFFPLVGPAATAQAGSGGVTSGTLEYDADPGEDNSVVVSSDGGGNIVIRDDGTLTGTATPVTVSASAGCSLTTPDTLTCPGAGVTAVRILTGDGADTIVIDNSFTGPASALLDGGSGNDDLSNTSSVQTTFVGGPGNDLMSAGTGNDIVDYSAAATGIRIGLRLSIAPDDGDGGSDQVLGFHRVTGSANNDFIEGSLGNDVLDGGPGEDVLSFLGAPSAVTADLGAGTSTGGEGTDSFSGFEDMVASNFDDHLRGSAGDNAINGEPGNDTIDYSSAGAAVTVDLSAPGAQNTGGAGTDNLGLIENVIGSPFGDTLSGDNGDNALDGAGGDDTLNGRLGDDTLTGGTGDDTASFADGSAVDANLATGVATGQGTDSLSGIENLTGSDNQDRLTGNASNNVLSGGLGNDTLDGGAGQDSLIGGGGTDTADYTNSPNPVTVDLAAGTASGYGLDLLSGITGVIGSAFDDLLTGDGNGNTLSGGNGSDVITGGDGADTVLGGLGNDTVFVRDAFVDTVACGPDTDAVTADATDIVGADCETVDANQPAATTTTVTSSANPSTIGQPVTLTATVSPNDGGGTVGFTVDGSPVPGCEAVPLSSSGGGFQATCAAGTGMAVGNHPAHATYTGDTRYLGSEGDLPGGQQVDKLSQTIVFPPLPSKSIVDLPFAITGVSGGGSGNPVTFTAGGACRVAGSTVTLLHTGTCTVTAHQAGNANYAAAPNVSRSFKVVGKPQLTITDTNTAEGSTGTHPLVFRVLLSRAVTVPVTVHWATANGTARAPGDFAAGSGTITFAPGQTVRTISVAIKGDHVKEPNEVFFVLLSNAQKATISDANASGGILNDD